MPICAICGKEAKKLTDDHIPPECVFPEERDYELLTVPACKPCNHGTHKDDEYFRILAADYRLENHPSAKAVAAVASRAIQKPEQKRFRERLMASTKPVDLHTPDGKLLKRGGELDMYLSRIGKVTIKVLKGLYFLKHGHPVPDRYHVICQELGFVLTSGLRADTVRNIEKVWIPTLLKQGTPEAVGPDVFRYWWGSGDTDLNVAFCYWELYGLHKFFGMVSRKLEG